MLETGPFQRELGAALEAAQSAGALLMEYLGQVSPEEKAPRDLVTVADRQSQELIESIVQARFPNHAIVGEEHPAGRDWTKGSCWVIDPLDGTTNFVHGLPGFSVSAAYCENGKPVLGVVFDPWLDECFAAVAGQSATLNGHPLRPSRCESLDKALLVSSFPSTVTCDCPELVRFTRVVQRATTRRLGSAALNLCYVAAGRLDGYWASTLKIWDIAAGIVIAQQAGATCRHLTGREMDWLDPQIVITATENLGDELLPLLQLDYE